MERLVRDCFRNGGYVFAERPEEIAKRHGISRVARLASNENPDPPSAATLGCGIAALHQANRYPDERVDVLVAALKRHFGEYPFVTGVGMDGVIETLFRTLVDCGDTVAIATPTFSFYSLAAVAQGATVVPVQRRDDFSIDPKKLSAAGKDAKVVVLCSPNNPTGNATPVDAVEEVLCAISGVLFLDCAYVEFSDIDYLPLLKRYDNLVIGRTFSKVHSLAGLRIGYAFVPAWLQPYYLRAGTPFSVNNVSAAVAAAALFDTEHAERYRAQVSRWRERFRSEVKYPVLPSDANFVMVDVSPSSGDAVAGGLAANGVIVRSCRSFPGLADHYIRVSVGEDWENERFIQAINNL
ncbi:MAG TPA: histidinol-phosphate transaminase [Methanoregulaceae archaeon]|nr:histidinol-phosphate transaminase [Methanoregulaceae archaeon]HPD76457.1 histidinol-phosphate transaminase [Methanoregulaceae archaeon]HRY75059.1 histidinol-phosphate transaminase [Methanoregulaceae archaeon]